MNYYYMSSLSVIHVTQITLRNQAPVAELADAQGLGPCVH